MVRASKGFTLIEALIALTVLGLVMLGVVGGFATVQQTFTQSARRDAAIAIVKRQLAIASMDLTSRRGTEGGLEWTVKVSEADARLAVATVTVNWKDQGQPRQLKISRVLLRPRSDSASTGTAVSS
jgi:prepilin-type N-terminal cleavage/methylation domain-containing protein